MARTLASLLVVLLVPPAWLALRGGADLDLTGGARVSWYQTLGPTVACAAALGAALLGAPGGRLRRVLLFIGLFVLGVVAWVAWTGPLRTPLLRVGHLGRPAGIAALALVLAWLPYGRVRLAARTRPLVPLAAAAVGLVLAWGVQRLDHADAQARIRSAAGDSSVPTLPDVAARGPGGAAPAASASLPDVILIVVDTLRADALGAWGAAPSPTPFLDGWLAGAVIWERAIATAPWTFPSMASLLTGLHPSTLDPHERGAFRSEWETLPRIAQDAPRLARELARAGYVTAAFQKNPYLAPGSGVETGFDLYEMVGGDRAELRAGAQITDAALRFAAALEGARVQGVRAPVFLYLHYMEPHVDYRPPDDFLSPRSRAGLEVFDGSARALKRLSRDGASAEQITQARRLYRDDVRYLDAQLARLEAGLRDAGVWSERSVVLLTADHGEQFGEHGGMSHPHDVHVETVHVPLALAAPGLAPRRVPQVASGVDVAPTLLALLGLPALPAAEGRNLLDGALEKAAVTEFGAAARATGPRFSLVRDAAGARLYDRASDPSETRDVLTEHPQEAAALGAVLDARNAAAARSAAAPRPEAQEPAAPPVDPALRSALEALGYLDAPTAQDSKEAARGGRSEVKRSTVPHQ